VIQGLRDRFKNLAPRHFINAGLATAAVGIAVGVWVSNGTVAGECAVNETARAALDGVATGELAALQVSGGGRSHADIAFVDDTGRPMTLADFEGKALLVNFWATWCGPCREEMPDLDALSADLGGERFEVVPINLDLGSEGGIEKAQEFLDRMDLPNLPLFADPTFEAFTRLKNQGVALGLPATLLLDGNGCEMAVLQGPARWDSEQGRDVIDTLIDQTEA